MPRQVVFIMTDTQRTDMVGCYGFPDMKTPSLDALAARGVRFDKAYTCQPVCGPARAALFTGTWPHNNGSWANGLPLGASFKHLGQLLRNGGVHGAYIGKWHLDASDYFGRGECPDGWDPAYWYDMRMYLEELSPADRKRSRDPRINREDGITADFTFGHRCSNRAVDFLSKHAEEDFCLVVSYDEPHGPFICPRPYSEMYKDYLWPKPANADDPLTDKPEHIRLWSDQWPGDKKNWNVRPQDFLGCNSFIDSEIGRVIAAIDTHAPDALVIYTSDHGDSMGSHRFGNKGPAMYDEVAKIPLIVRWPGKTPGQSACAHPVSHIDLVPSILAAFEITPPTTLDGKSMLDTFRNPSHRPNDAVFIEFGRYEVSHDGFGGWQPMRAIFDGRYKLGIHLLSGDEMYDLQDDPAELINLIESPAHVTIRNQLHDRLLKWMNDTIDPFRGYYWERRPWRTDARPASWGYTSMTRQPLPNAGEKKELDYDTGLEFDQPVRKK